MSDITYINKDLLMEGTLESKEGQVIIAGTFKGNVTAKSLILESTCKFNGNIKYIDHHESHIASSLFFSKFNDFFFCET